MTCLTLPTGWVLNNREYFYQVTHNDRQFRLKADPKIDAYMWATGNVRDVFNLNSFVERHNNILPALQRMRKKALDNVQGTSEQVHEPEMPSQTCWTSFRKISVHINN